jgi:pimeloyl-ACP methyl ester carboxylesterase
LAAITTSVWELRAQREGLVLERAQVGSIPITVFRQPTLERAPVVVVAHGFAGSQQLMQPVATTLALDGYLVVTFDFPGHGRNPDALAAGMSDVPAMRGDLLDSFDRVVAHALALPQSDGRLAVLGHSMAADVVVRYADAHPNVQATVALSLFLPQPQTFRPRNLLIVDGALEPAMLREQAFTHLGLAAGEQAATAVTYGNFDDGSARRVYFAPRVEHIGVLYSARTLRESRAWLNAAFERTGNSGAVDIRIVWLIVLAIGVVLLPWPLLAYLPPVASLASRRPVAWRSLFVLALAPALLTPLILWKLPTDFLPLLLGDYLAAHFLVYGLLTALGLWWLQRGREASGLVEFDRTQFVMALIIVLGYSVLMIGISIDQHVMSVMPAPWRLPLVAAIAIGTLPYFVADEWLTRRIAARRGAYLLTKACFLLSLALAIALNPAQLFFLAIIVPAILLLFAVYGLFSAWTGRHTGHPLVAAVANAVVFAWLIAMTFPLVD